jgi:hypothetical protein
MKIELILTDEQVRLMHDVLASKSFDIHIVSRNYLSEYIDAKDKKHKAARLDDMSRANRQSLMLDTIADMIQEQYDANKRKL